MLWIAEDSQRPVFLLTVFFPGVTGSAAEHHRTEDSDERRADGQPLGFPAEGRRSHTSQAEERE